MNKNIKKLKKFSIGRLKLLLVIQSTSELTKHFKGRGMNPPKPSSIYTTFGTYNRIDFTTQYGNNLTCIEI